MLDQSKCWQAVLSKDKSFDGQFLYGVLTTKVFCRPGCPSRAPKRENVRFYLNSQEALAAGLRACLRCTPLDSETDAARARCRAACVFIRRNLENSNALKLVNLSRRFGLSPFHFQRTFKSIVGVSPRQYVDALRLQILKQDLQTGTSVTEATYNAGFGSSSRVHERSSTRLGMTPKQYRSGGGGLEISYAVTKTPLGLLMLGATDRGLCFLEFGNSLAELLVSLQQEYPNSIRVASKQPYSDDLTGWMTSLSIYLEGERMLQKIPVALHGTAFQLKVWSYLQRIPAGSVQSYSEVAQAIGHPKAARAVASACAANRIAIVVPCHRVIRGDGGMGGYRWGLDRKRTLLDTERHIACRAIKVT